MSLFSEADSLKNEASGIDLMPGRDARIVWLWRAVFGGVAVLTLSYGYILGYRSNSSEYSAFYEQEKVQVLEGLRKSADSIRVAMESDDAEDYPFIDKPRIHNFNIRYSEDDFASTSGDPRRTDSAAKSGRDDFYADEYETSIPKSSRDRKKDDTANSGIEIAARQDKKSPARQPDTKPRQENRVETKKPSVQDLFYEAVESTGGMESFQPEAGRSQKARDRKMSQEAMPLGSLPDSIKNQIPSFVYNAHNYSTDSSRRSVTLNGVSVKEGGRFRNLDVVKIGEDYVVFRVQGQSFSWKAMDDYR